ncbi:MAG: response regulator [Thermodesulfobacteriota bacterium]
MRILLVDDSRPMREPLRLQLRSMGHDVEVADDGEEALKVFRQSPFDIVVTDIRMPRMDGLELLRAIKQEKAETDVIMVTGYGDMDTSLEALRSGAVNYLLKPVNLEEMELSVKAVERRREMTRRLKEQEERLIQARKMAELGIIVAGVAHEINNPNAVLRGNIQIMRKFWTVLEPFLRSAAKAGVTCPSNLDYIMREVPQTLEAMLGATDRIKSIVANTAVLAGMQPGTGQTIDLNRCVTEALKIVDLASSGIQVKLNLAGNLPLVRGTPESLVEVVVELLKNGAMAVSGRPVPEIEITTSQTSSQEVFLVVADNGPGILPEHQDKIFTPFFTTDPRIGRPGLGLSKVYALVNGCGGRVFFTSRENQGARFNIGLNTFETRSLS